MKTLNAEKIVLCFGFAGVAAAIFLLSYFDQRGLSNEDSIYFMALARSLSQDLSFFPHGGHNSWWPPLYGVLTGIVAKAGIGDVIWASKFLNVACFAITAVLLYRISPSHDPLVMLAVFPASVITISFFSLSDILFLPILTLNLLACVRLYETGCRRFVLLMALSALFLFLNRYIGFFILSVNGLFVLWLYVKRRLSFGRFVYSALFLTVSAGLMGLYLYFNFKLTGMITGPRYSSPETFFEYTYQIIRVFGDDINLMMVGGHNHLILFGSSLLVQITVLWLVFKNGQWKALFPSKENIPALLFLSTGAIYLLTLIAIRATTETMHLHYRYTAPGVFLIVAGLLFSWTASRQSTCKNSRVLLMSLMFVSLFVSVTTQALLNSQRSSFMFPEFREMTIEKYKGVPPKTIILWGEHLINYYSRDVFVTHPHWNTRRTGETWDGFLYRIRKMYPDHAIFLQRFETRYIDGLNQHETVNRALYKLLENRDQTEWLIPVYIPENWNQSL
ncbi:4-amino-4-deoxy-L-arabinose transferase [Cyclonatronum proteinivorum]|uniref:4-amino-4-deoxy-L-arabinose transferase n=1 Tax=Cyclonatronum proteinivorum TaxID=1457365 RepID=A0A345ULD2_9BACT|nr:hypothetical protein [Cyclonatronum proteinivorum]AXJ01284.1 4-amino-4-deoxy-L-arabinose transferase [Cyclonatronum proteinivorum]